MSKRPLIGGLVAGFLAAILAIAVIIAALPGPTDRAVPSATPGSSATSAATANPSNGTSLAVGAAPAAFSVSQLGGGTIDLAGLAGKPVWIDFVATTCTACRSELALMSGYAATYSAKGLVAIVVFVGEDESLVSPYVTNLALPIPVAIDDTKAAANAGGVSTLPTHVWIDTKGVVRAVSAGATSKAVMEQALSTIIPGAQSS